jgi:predicted thioesterase
MLLEAADHVRRATRTAAAPKVNTNGAMMIRVNGATRAPTKNVVHAPPVPVGSDVMVAVRPDRRAATLDPVIRADPSPTFDAVRAAPIVTNVMIVHAPPVPVGPDVMIVRHATVDSNDPRTVAPVARRVTTRTAIVGPVFRRVPSVPVHVTERATNDRDVTVLDGPIAELVS